MTIETNPSSAMRRLRTRWAAIGAAVAVTLGAGTIATVDAVQDSGKRLTYVANEPCRLIDTRPDPIFNVGPRKTPLGPTGKITVDARGAEGQCTAAQLPSDAVALALNVTVPSATADGFLTIWPDGPRPNASSLNPSPGQPPAPNAVTTPLSPGGTFELYNENGSTHVIIDVVGYHVDHNHDDRYVRLDALGDSGFIAGGTVNGSSVTGFNGPDGVSASANRQSEGTYVLTITGLSAPLAPIVQITPFGSNTDEARACSLGAISGGTTVSIPINCFGEDAGIIVAKDAAFQFLIVG